MYNKRKYNQNPQSMSVSAASVDLQQYESRHSVRHSVIFQEAIAAAAVALALVLAGLRSRPVHQHPAPASAVVVLPTTKFAA